jgi:hypothetical protein
MATEVNKNKKWTNKSDIKKRRKKVANEISISSIASIISLYVASVKAKHL